MSEQVILVAQVLVPCIDAPNINGRTYTMAAVESMMEQINENPTKRVVFSDWESSIQQNLERIVGLVQRAYIENGQLMVDVKLLHTPNGVIIKDMLQHKKFSIRSTCKTQLSKDAVVESPEYVAAFFCEYQEN